MSIRVRVNRAFTLVEVMIAVLVIAMLTISLYRFVSANLTAIRISTEMTEEKMEIVSLVNMLQMELNDLQGRAQVIQGVAHKFNDLPADELTWQSLPGNGLFTKAVPNDEYRITLALKPISATSRTLQLGIKRRSVEAPETDREDNFLPLVDNVAALQFHYFSPAVNQWLPGRWNDTGSRPPLIRIRIWRTGEATPYEAVLPVAGTAGTNAQP